MKRQGKISRKQDDLGHGTDSRRNGEDKREHWAVENRLHHVLDDAFREDRSPAKKSKHNLALIRKFAYNILRIAILYGDCAEIMTEAMDDFSDDLLLRERNMSSAELRVFIDIK